MNVIARLKYELAYYDSAVHRFNHYTTRTPPLIFVCTELNGYVRYLIFKKVSDHLFLHNLKLQLFAPSEMYFKYCNLTLMILFNINHFFAHCNNSLQLCSLIRTNSNGPAYYNVIPIIQFLHTVKWFQVFHTNSFICTLLNGFKYSTVIVLFVHS